MHRLTTAFLTLVLLCLAHNVHAATKSVRAEVNGMVCAFCSSAVEKKLKAMPETRAVYVNLARRVVAVEVKDGAKVSLEAVKARIVEAGYDVRSITESEQTIDEIRASLK
ncbi:MAG: heavy-metal-associated domain-containing protein [Burkholderiales bacterium]